MRNDLDESIVAFQQAPRELIDALRQARKDYGDSWQHEVDMIIEALELSEQGYLDGSHPGPFS